MAQPLPDAPDTPPGGGHLDLARSFTPLSVAVLTVSDTREAGDDKSGDLLAERATRDGHTIVARALVSDDKEQIAFQVRQWLTDSSIQVIIATGGTGITSRDVTPEVFVSLFEKSLDGFGEAFRSLSFASVGTSAVQSRACAGVAHGTLLFVLPGSPSACRDGWDKLLRWQLDSRHRPCNLAEMLPRL